MSNFYRSAAFNHGKNEVWGYSERGALMHFCTRTLPTKPGVVAKAILHATGKRFAEIFPGKVTNCISIGEFDLGKKMGFGCPDGGFLMKIGRESVFAFVEGKRCSFAKAFMTPNPDSCKGFNSSLNGQLELRWRFVNCLSKMEAGQGSVVSERRCPPPPALRKTDIFYQNRVGKNVFRTVDLQTVEPIGDLVRSASRVILLAITDDEDLPSRYFDDVRIYRADGTEITKNEPDRPLFWIPLSSILNDMKKNT